MNESIISMVATGAAIVLGVMNFLKHQHLERDMKRYPLVLTIEIGYDDDMKPTATIRDMQRDRAR